VVKHPRQHEKASTEQQASDHFRLLVELLARWTGELISPVGRGDGRCRRQTKSARRLLRTCAARCEEV